MDGWIRILFENIEIVVVVLVALAAPLWKTLAGRQEGRPDRRRAHPMPSFGGGPGERMPPEAGDWRESPEAFQEDDVRRALQREEERRAEQSERLAREREAMGEGVTLEGEREPERKPEPPGRSAARSGLPVRRIEAAPEPVESDAGGAAPGREELAKAVVWSEILGPPRSKRPYRRY